jgi:hypothetical protein
MSLSVIGSREGIWLDIAWLRSKENVAPDGLLFEGRMGAGGESYGPLGCMVRRRVGLGAPCVLPANLEDMGDGVHWAASMGCRLHALPGCGIVSELLGTHV